VRASGCTHQNQQESRCCLTSFIAGGDNWEELKARLNTRAEKIIEHSGAMDTRRALDANGDRYDALDSNRSPEIRQTPSHPRAALLPLALPPAATSGIYLFPRGSYAARYLVYRLSGA